MLETDRRPTLTREAMRLALRDANIPTLLLALAHLTGDARWLDHPYRPTRPRGLDDHDTGGLSEELQDEIRTVALEAWCDAGGQSPARLTPDEVPERLGISLAEPVDPAYGPLLAEELGLIARDPELPATSGTCEVSVLVVGAGVAGINAAIKLKTAGFPFVVLEKNDGYGGTWLENRYPGCGVDTPSHLYSFSFAPNPRWNGYFAAATEVGQYLHDLVDRHGLAENIQLRSEVRNATWDDATARWQVAVARADGTIDTLHARALISAVGHFNQPSIPPIHGLDAFPGPVMHTARWDASVDLEGKRVAVIGSGASAMQVVPALAGVAAELVVFQRSRQWAVPHPNVGRRVTDGVKLLLEHFPYYGGWYRLRQLWRFGDRLQPALLVDPDFEDPDFAVNATNAAHRTFLTKYIEKQLDGRPDLIERSVPEYPTYGKRPLIDHGWYRSIRRPDVQLIEGSVESVDGSTLVTADGGRYDVDAVVLATGFRTLDLLGSLAITGRSGRSLREVWGPHDARAHLGITVPEFPNFFMLFGPNTNAGHGGSAFLTTEFQVRYVMELLATLRVSDQATLECRQEAHDRYNAEVDAALAHTVWTHPAVDNYYRNEVGRIVGTLPFSYLEYWHRTRHPVMDDFDLDT